MKLSDYSLTIRVEQSQIYWLERISESDDSAFQREALFQFEQYRTMNSSTGYIL